MKTSLLLTSPLLLISALVGAPERPNVIIMLMDDMGVNDIGAYTHPSLASPGPPPASAPTDGMNALPPPNRAYDPAAATLSLTPRIDSLATEGVRFTRFNATHSVCTPTRASLLTGSYAARVGLESVILPGWPDRDELGLNSTELSLPELLRARGYATGMSGKWHLGHHPDFYPVRHGFERWFGILYSNDIWTANPYNSSWPELDLMEGENELGSYTTATGHTISGPVDTIAEQSFLLEAMTEQAVVMIDDAVGAGRPFFLYYAPHAPHVPIHPHPDYLSPAGQTDDVARYDDQLRELDARVGAILDRLDFHGIAEETLVIFTSDNGPWQDRPGPGDLYEGCGSAYPYRGRKNSTWDGGHRVPFLARMPGSIPAGAVRDPVASTFDLYTTVATLAGAELPPYEGIDGQDIWPLLTGSDLSRPHEAFYYYDASRDTAEAVIDLADPDQWKLVSGSTSPSHNGLFRIGSGFSGDFQELSNLSSSFSSVRSALLSQLNAWNSGLLSRETGLARALAIELETDTIIVDENSTATARIRLSAPANKTVHVARYTGDADLQVTGGATLEFSAANWDQWQAVTFSFIPDLDTADGGAVFRAYGDQIDSSQDLHVRELFVFERDTLSAPPVSVSLSVIDESGSPFLALTYQQVPGGAGIIGSGYTASGLSWTVETNSDLGEAWLSGPGYTTPIGDPVPVDPLREEVTVRLAVPLSPGIPQFLRLNVE